jgi:hypothetical protein
LASIDGGHTAECVYSDLKLVEAVVPAFGVVLLDDYFNEDWPDVATGASRYFLEPESKLRPFAVAPNKILLTTAEYIGFYQRRIKEDTDFKRHKVSKMFGVDVDVFHGPSPAQPLWANLREFVRETPIGPYLIRARQYL